MFCFISVTNLFGQQLNKQIEDFTSSNLPIIFINTNGQTIEEEPKIMATMGIIYNGEGNRNSISDQFNEYDGWIGIEYRGNASYRISDKKPYTIETRNEDGSNNNVKLLGLPKDNDFILRAGYIDKTLMRDALAYYMYRSMGRWAPRTRHVELFLNGSYQGVYILEEKIKPDNNRLDITKMDTTDNTGEAVTGGYIWCTNRRWGTEEHNDLIFDTTEADGNQRFLRYPKPEDVTPEQFDYIRQYEQEFCDVMNGYNYNVPYIGYDKYIDVPSFIDEIIIQELTSNSDAYGYSGYFHKDRGGKICAGPEWDFDQALCNSSYNDGARTDEWIISKPSGSVPTFWFRLFPIPAIQTELKTRWSEFRKDALSNNRIFAYVDSVANYLSEAQEHNFQKWPILGVSIWRSLPGAEERDTYQKEVDYMKQWLIKHLEWMDSQWKIETDANSNNDELPNNFSLEQNYPNPFNPATTISFTIPNVETTRRVVFTTLRVYDILGNEITTLVNEEKAPGNYHVTFNPDHAEQGRSMTSGIYFYRLTAGSYAETKKMIFLK